jgi:phosphoribosyl 1,2-cyclic phosphodiesterase
MEVLRANIRFKVITENPFAIGPLRVAYRSVNHPGTCFSYRISESGRSFIFSTDTELTEDDFKKTEDNLRFYNDADVIVLDTQYTLGEAIERTNWGHSSYSMAVDFTAEFNIRRLVLYHHEPQYDDNRMARILRSANWYLDRIGRKDILIDLGTEGMEIVL